MSYRLLSILLWLAVPALLYSQGARPAAAALPLDSVALLDLPALDNQALLAAELESRRPGRAPRFAQPIAVDLRPERSGAWEILPNGNALWRLRIRSQDAHSLNLGFSEYHMPPGASLILYDPQEETVMGPFSPADNESHEQLWTPALPGEELVLELQLPASEREHIRLWLTSVNHDFLDFYQMTTGACHLDVACGAANGWGVVDGYRDIIQSVAVYGFGGSTFCTGFLVNNTNQDCRPYFITAYHCDVKPADAPSVVVYWNYANSSCRQPNTVASSNPGNGSLNNFTTGATYRAGYPATDFVLLELNAAPPASSQAFFAGWSREATPPQDTVVCIHHPDGAEKRISLAYTDTYTGAWGSGSQEVPNGNHLIVPNWSVGSTEVGSSGGPLFNKQSRVVGQLHGGGASCNSNSYDSFGWFRASWEGGGTANTRLKDWLAPNGENLFFLDGQWLSGCNAAVFVEAASESICVPGQAVFEIRVAEAFAGPVSLSVSGLPAEVNYAFSANPVPSGGSTTLTLTNLSSNLPPGPLSFTVTASDQQASASEVATVNLVTQAPGVALPLSPATGEEGTSLAPTFAWSAAMAATAYDIQIAADTSFSSLLASLTNLSSTTYQGINLQAYRRYYYRVRGRNLCGPGPWSLVSSFRTSAISCQTYRAADLPISISGGPPNTIASTLPVDAEGTVASVAIRNLDIEHTYVGDLSARLRSPDGTLAQLFNRPGFPLIPFGCPGDDLFLHFFDQAPATAYDLEGMCENQPAISGAFRPITPFATFMGKEAGGDWRLIVIDDFSQDGGQLNNWQLEVCSTFPPRAEVFVEQQWEVCAGEGLTVPLFVGAGFTGPVTLLTLGMPNGVVASFSEDQATPGTFAELHLDQLPESGTVFFLLYAADGPNVHVCELQLQIVERLGPVALISPVDASPVFAGEQFFSWGHVAQADSFLLELARDIDFQQLALRAATRASSYVPAEELDAGQYFWRVTPFNQCEGLSSSVFTFYKEGAVTSAQSQAQPELSVFPNPSSGWLYLQLPDRTAQATANLHDSQGRLLVRSVFREEASLDLTKLPAGLYWLRVQMGAHQWVEKVVLHPR